MGKVTFTKKQNDLMRLFKQQRLPRLTVLQGSVRSGKTWISLILWALWVASRPREYLYMMSAKSLQTLKRNCLLPLQELIGERNFTFSLSAKEGILFGKKIMLEGANDARSENKIRGITLGGAYCDELTLFPEDFFTMLLSRLSAPGAKLFATTNPDVPTHWLKKKYLDNEKLADDLLNVFFSIDDNTTLPLDYVRNTAYLYGTRRTVELTEVPKWAMLLPEGRIPSDIPMIATFRTPYANNIDCDSELPISIFANSLGTLHEIDEAHTDYRAEFKKLAAKIFADKTVLKGDTGIPDDYFVGVSGDGTSTIEQQIMAFAPQIREAELRAGINSEIRFYETQVGISSGTFTFDPQKGLVTATQVLSEDRTTYNTVCQIQRQLRPVLQSLSQIIVTLARFYGVEYEDGECAIEFGDSVFEDTGTEYNRRFQMVQSGILKPELLVSWYFGVPNEKALEMMPPMTELFGGE